MIILKHVFFRKKYFTLLKSRVVRHIQGVHVVATIFLVKYREKILSMVQNELHIHKNIFSAVLLSFSFFNDNLFFGRGGGVKSSRYSTHWVGN